MSWKDYGVSNKDEDYPPTGRSQADLPYAPSETPAKIIPSTDRFTDSYSWLGSRRATPSHGFRKLGNSLVVARTKDVCLAQVWL
jgi:hypothetical protein